MQHARMKTLRLALVAGFCAAAISAGLQAQPANEIYEFRLRERAELDGYSWVDRNAGTVRIPIAEAMRLTVERGLPSRPVDGAAAGVSAETSTLTPTDASAGRTLERRRQ